MRVYYDNGEGVLKAHGNLFDYSENYYCEFTDIQPFLDIVDYIGQHPDIFFDYSEFGGEPELPIAWPGGDEMFSFQLLDCREGRSNLNYCIAKGIGGDKPAVPEVENVINMIKNAFMDELLQHPE